MDPQLLIFDLDGTLVDSRADLAAAVNHMRGGFGLAPLPPDTVEGYIGDGVAKLVERSLQGAPIDFGEALRAVREYYLAHLAVHTRLYDGVGEGLRRLAAVHALAVLTNKPGDAARALLRHFDLSGLFRAVVGGGDAGALKPDPAGVYRCMASAGADAAHTWMVGDHHVDLAAAKNAGIRSAFVRYGFGEARDGEPDAYFSSFPELVGYFSPP
jgi:phosphoglycolate phosphatase